MELPTVMYDKKDYVETAYGNKVSRSSILCGSQCIVLEGKSIIHPECIIRGDLSNVKIGKRCVLEAKSVIRPSFKKRVSGLLYIPLSIGDHVFIGKDSIVNAAKIESYVHIGENCVIGRRSILKVCCMIADNTVLPPETVVSPFSCYSGNPGVCVSELPACTKELMIQFTKEYYESFIPR